MRVDFYQNILCRVNVDLEKTGPIQWTIHQHQQALSTITKINNNDHLSSVTYLDTSVQRRCTKINNKCYIIIVDFDKKNANKLYILRIAC